MDYYKIGQRIRKYRKANNLSQEELAEKIDISVTHMSHIETGNTKLSLPVLVRLAKVLDVGTDELLFGNKDSQRSASVERIVETLEHSSTRQLRILSDILVGAKIALEKNL